MLHLFIYVNFLDILYYFSYILYIVVTPLQSGTAQVARKHKWIIYVSTCTGL